MAKRDNNTDGTPIEFRIQNSKGASIPVPINQPHWKYKKYHQTRPTMKERIGVTVFASTLFIAGILILFSNNSTAVSWIFSLGMIAISIGFIHQLIWRERSHRARNSELDKESQPQKKEKKQPKNRKDYR